MSAAPVPFPANRRLDVDPTDPMDARTRVVAARFRGVMEALGLDLDDPNLADTPSRVARAYRFLFSGLEAGAEPDLRTFPNDDRYRLSKLARTVELFARRPQVQERLTEQVASFLDSRLQPAGVMIVVQARHFCMEMRGVRKAGARTTTSAVRGAFADDARARSEFLARVRGVR